MIYDHFRPFYQKSNIPRIIFSMSNRYCIEGENFDKAKWKKRRYFSWQLIVVICTPAKFWQKLIHIYLVSIVDETYYHNYIVVDIE